MKKLRNNLTQLPRHMSPRCGARTRKRTPCQSPAMANGRCRLHGGKSPGAPQGNRNAWKHGRYSAKAIEERRLFREIFKAARETMAELVS